MSQTPLNLGFLTILQEATGYVGGYLVTNTWGRPLEFRLSTAVQPNRVQNILYAATLKPYICADLIAKTLVDKTTTPVQLLVTDTEDVLDLRHRVETPVVWLRGAEEGQTTDPVENAAYVRPAEKGRGAVLGHARYPDDVPKVREQLAGLEGLIDLAEPFARIREAIAEARKMGVTNRN